MIVVHIDRGSKAWDAVWEALRLTIIADGLGDGTDLAQYDPEMAEGWQYLGSYTNGGKVEHEFRHRHHPVTRTRVYRTVYTEETT